MPLIRQTVLVLAAAATAACTNGPLQQGTIPDASTGAGRNGVGGPCDLLANAGPNDAVYNNQALECPSRICIKPRDSVGGVDTAPFCSAECSQNGDCLGQIRDPSSPSDRRCKSGFVCGAAFNVGPLCCKNLCLCNDFFAQPPPTAATCVPYPNSGMGCSE
jgi:hypothetical protein